MCPADANNLYNALVGQISKEDDLYFKRLAFVSTISGALLSAIFLSEINNIELTIISLIALGITYFINLQINEGRGQLRTLKEYYYTNISIFNEYPIPFFSYGQDNDLKQPGISRTIKGFYFTWICVFAVSLVRHFGII